MLKQIMANYLMVLLFTGCTGNFYEKTFLAKYEFESFSQFSGVHIFIRGMDSARNPIIMINAPSLINDSLRVGLYVVTLSKKNYQVIETKWTLSEHSVDADTTKLQQLARTFLQYEIPRLHVDDQGNVFVYLKDLETLSLVRFVNEKELLKRSKETKWIKVRNNWYRQKW